MSTIGFIGLGHMGGPMAKNLVAAGHDVRGYDLSPEACTAAGEAGVVIAGSAAETVADAEVIFTMVPAGRHVLDLYQGDGEHPGILSAAGPGTLFIDSSTIAVDEARQAHDLAVAAGHRFLDAPVSGGVVGAENGTLAFMVGGDEKDFAQATPLLEAMGRRLVHCGGPGLGQAAKVCNNMILAVSQIAVAEAFVLGESLGLDHQTLFDVASNATGQCWALNTNCPVPGPVPTSPANRGYEPGFAAALMSKDLGLAEHAIDLAGVDAKMGRLARQMYQAYADGEGGGRDFSGIIETIRAHSATTTQGDQR